MLFIHFYFSHFASKGQLSDSEKKPSITNLMTIQWIRAKSEGRPRRSLHFITLSKSQVQVFQLQPTDKLQLGWSITESYCVYEVGITAENIKAVISPDSLIVKQIGSCVLSYF